MVLVGLKQGITVGFEGIFGKTLVRKFTYNSKGIRKYVGAWKVYGLVKHIKKAAVQLKEKAKRSVKIEFLKTAISFQK